MGFGEHDLFQFKLTQILHYYPNIEPFFFFFWKVYSVLIHDWLIAMILDDFPTLFNTYQLDQVAQVYVQLDFETYSRYWDFTASLGNPFQYLTLSQ